MLVSCKVHALQVISDKSMKPGVNLSGQANFMVVHAASSSAHPVDAIKSIDRLLLLLVGA
jgi:hypothetical protein